MEELMGIVDDDNSGDNELASESAFILLIFMESQQR
jgi:hypothetical protein